jgi:copper ion binding protein
VRTTQTTITVTGMTCDHCARAVRDEVGELEGVERVDVDLASGRVVIAATAPLDAAALRGAVEEAGYQVGPS